MPRKRVITPEQEQEVIDLVRSGHSQKKAADATGLSIATVSRIMRRARARREAAPVPRTGDISADAERLRSELLSAAFESLALARSEHELGGSGKDAMTAAGIATQRFLEVHKHLATNDGLPEELPDDRDEAARIVRRAQWQAAKASPQVMKQLADALGVHDEDDRDVVITFDNISPSEPGVASALSGEGPTGDS